MYICIYLLCCMLYICMSCCMLYICMYMYAFELPVLTLYYTHTCTYTYTYTIYSTYYVVYMCTGPATCLYSSSFNWPARAVRRIGTRYLPCTYYIYYIICAMVYLLCVMCYMNILLIYVFTLILYAHLTCTLYS